MTDVFLVPCAGEEQDSRADPERLAPWTVDPARLLRLQASLDALVAELRQLPAGSLSAGVLAHLFRAELDEAEEVAPPALRAELHQLVGPDSPEARTERGLRVMLAGLDGWVQGLSSQLGFVVTRSSE